MHIPSFLGLLSAALLVNSQDIDPAADLNTFGNNTLFNRWRPQYHFLAPAGWMNVCFWRCLSTINDDADVIDRTPAEPSTIPSATSTT